MSGRLHSILTIFLSLILIISTGGCHRDVPTPPVSAPATSSTSIAQPAAKTDTHDTPFELESDFVLLTRDQFDSFGAESETWTTTTDGVACSGKPRGYLFSKSPYKDFTLRLEYRFPRPPKLNDDAKFKGNTGFLVYVTGEHKLWPTCIEVQGKYAQMATIKENGGAPPVSVKDDDAVRQQVRKPVGQWNELEIVSRAGSLDVSLNGTHISSSQAGTLSEGLIGIQSEDHPFEVRRMRIKPE